jgi:hypothetical protein
MMLGWLGWTIVYAVVIWGMNAIYGLLERRLNDANPRGQEAAALIRFLVPLGLALSVSGCAHGGGRSAHFWSAW